MVAMGGRVLQKLSGWAEGCPCHQGLYDTWLDRQDERYKRKTHLRERTGQESCPLDTRRAPECAAGDFKELLRIANVTLLTNRALGPLSEEQRATILRDFGQLRRHVLFLCSVKLRFWQQLPWILFGTAHYDRHKAFLFSSNTQNTKQQTDKQQT